MNQRALILFATALVTACAAPPPKEPPEALSPKPEAGLQSAQEVDRDLAAFEAFNQRFDGQWRVEWNRQTGTPHRIYGHALDVAAPESEREAAAVSRRVLIEYAEVLRIDPQALEISRADFEPAVNESARGTWYINYAQTYEGLPVLGGNVRLVIRSDKLTMLGSDFYRNIRVPTQPELTLGQAVARVRAGAEVQRPVRDRLVVVPRPGVDRIRYHLAWDFTMPVETMPAGLVGNSGVQVPGQPDAERAPSPDEEIPVQFRYFVDAQDGELLERRNEMVYEDVGGDVTGQVFPIDPDTPQETRPIRGLTVTAQQGATTFTDLTDDTGHYNLTGLAAGNVTFDTHFENPDLRVWNNDTPDPDATHSATVTAPGTHDWDWASDDPSPNDVETHTFFHLQYIQEWFRRGAPFDVLPDPSPMEAFVQNGAYCNAGASSGGLFFGSGTASCEDFALCADIVYHEYTHRVVAKVYDTASVSLPYSGQTGAMNEAWSDYFGSSNIDLPTHGTGCYSGRNLDMPDRRFADDWVGEVHADGLIFGGSLWDTRVALGTNYTDMLAMRGMKNATTSFSDYLGALLEEDDDPAVSSDPGAANNNPTDGTPNIDTICHAWWDLHGVFHPYCAGYTDTLVADITLPAPDISYNLYDASATSVTVEGSALGSSTVALSSYTIEYAHHSSPSTWQMAGVTLTGSGTSPVSDGVLGQINLSGLSDGLYVVRLTVTGTDASTATSQSRFVLDTELKAGWPQQSDRHFYASPAVVDIDPATPGLEVVGLDNWGYVHVWHHDGTVAAGWPSPAQGSVASPAVADLDGDGSLEIVAAGAYGRVKVFEADGSTTTGWPVDVPTGERLSTPALTNLDGDADLEIVVASEDGNVYAWHHDGTAVAGWPVAAGAAVEASPAAGDIDADGNVEVVVGTTAGQMQVWDGGGTAKAGWPVDMAATTSITASAALGDVDADGDMEIFVGTRDTDDFNNNRLHAWHHDGTAVTGWPQNFDSPPTSVGFQMAPASADLGDIDGDGTLEVVAMTNDDNVHIWEADGTPVAGWPPAGPGGSFYEFFISSPVIADIDGDGDMELVFEGFAIDVAGMNAFAVYAYHHDGTAVTGWPKVIPGYSNSSPAVADLDRDGTVEVLVGSDGMFVWDLAGAYGPTSAEWPLYRGDNRRTGAYGPLAGVSLLMDTSGSMSWLPDGSLPGPGEDFKRRINLAREAVYPFMELLNDFGAVETNFGIAAFPEHPFTGCTAETITPMTLTTTASKDEAVGTTIPGLVTGGSTPLLAGMDTAIGMFGEEGRRVIVLLSDGYHNCPSVVSVGDASVTDLVGRLQDNNVRVFTIGFGRPSDVDHPLLEELANETTPTGFSDSQFYDVTTPAFDPATWDPATALQATYKNILVDALGLETTLDPLGVIGSLQTHTHQTQLTPLDQKVSFFVSWKTPDADRLVVRVSASDGSVLSAGTAGVTVHNGDTYRIVTVDRRVLDLPGKVTADPWTLTIEGGRFPGTEPYQYSVIVDSSLRLRAGTTRDNYRTGQAIKITAQLTAEGKPLTDDAHVQITVTGPGGALGNWFVDNPVDPEELAQVPAEIDNDRLLPWQRQARFLSQVRGIPLPGVGEPRTLELHDDGTHGDAAAGDGIYTNKFDDTRVAGTYEFHVRAEGALGDDHRFDRDSRFQRRIDVNVATARPEIKVESLAAGRAILRVLPRDRFGNYLPPGRAPQLNIRLDRGVIDGDITDAFNGGYRVPVKLPEGVKPEALKITPVLKAPKPVVRPRLPDARIPRDISLIEQAWLEAYLKAVSRRAWLNVTQ